MAYLRLRQVCLAARTLEPMVSDIAAIFGLKVCHRDPNVARYGLENALLPVGDSFIEIVAPTRELARLVLLDAAHLQEEEARHRARWACRSRREEEGMSIRRQKRRCF